MTPSNDLKIPVITSVYDEETNLVVQVTEDREDDTVILTSSNELVRTLERDSSDRVHIVHSLGTPFMTSESSGQVVKLTDLQMTVLTASHEYHEGLFPTSEECAVLLGGDRRSKNDPVQVPEELERMNSIKHIALPAEGTSFIQLRIPLMIPVVKALTTQHKAQTCNNCDERVVAKQTFCYPEWCEALWSTREIHT